MMKKLLPYILTVAICFICTANALAQQATQMPVTKLVESYQQATSAEQKKVFLNDLYKTKIETKEDAQQLRKVFASKQWDEDLFAVEMNRIPKIENPELDEELLAILQDEKEFITKVDGIKDTEELNKRIQKKEMPVTSEREARYRCMNIGFAISKLGNLKSKKAVPVLKDLLKYKGTQYSASVALAQIGDTSASEELRERAYRGEEVNFGGQGLKEAKNVVEDLENKGNKAKWPKIADQIILIKDPAAKPYLKKLFNHEKSYVIDQATVAYSNMADIGDANDIIEMTKHDDWHVRARAIIAMQKITTLDFADNLINLLNDSELCVRHHAAKALGYKKIKAAVPYLEKALDDKDLIVRKAVFVALFILTDKKYDFKGRTASVDETAENEKRYPSFY